MQNAFLKIPFDFSEVKLLADLQICSTFQFTPHFNTRDYTGDWTSISLRSPSGEVNNIVAHAGSWKDYKDTPVLKKCQYFSEIIASFHCEKESIRLLKLAPGSKIKEHTDLDLSYADGLFRIHIPIQTNPLVEFYINHKKVVMDVGTCWYGDFNLPHGVSNLGETDRVHLVMDCVRNDWSDALFKKMGYEFEKERKKEAYSYETKLKMIEALRYLDTVASKELLRQLQEEVLSEKDNL
jgi:hypothetical protein